MPLAAALALGAALGAALLPCAGGLAASRRSSAIPAPAAGLAWVVGSKMGASVRRRSPDQAALRAGGSRCLVSSMGCVVPAGLRAGAAAPRFDAFCDALVGPWVRSQDGRSFPVEEVMRSCGGAVQGVREMQSELYHNRADDGFIYFPCGSYSTGPVALGAAENAELTFTASLAFAHSKHRQLVTLKCVPQPAGVQGVPWSVAQCTRSGLQREGAAGAKTAGGVSSSASGHRQTVLRLDGELGCRMPAGGPMQIARAKWEMQSPELLQFHGVGGGWEVPFPESGLPIRPHTCPVDGWVALASSAEPDCGLWGAWDYGPAEQGGVLVQIGAVCPLTVLSPLCVEPWCFHPWCMCVCVNMYVCMYVYLYLYISIYLSIYLSIYIYI